MPAPLTELAPRDRHRKGVTTDKTIDLRLARQTPATLACLYVGFCDLVPTDLFDQFKVKGRGETSASWPPVQTGHTDPPPPPTHTIPVLPSPGSDREQNTVHRTNCLD